MKIAAILSNRTVLKGLEKISEHGTSFSAATSLALSLSLRPLAIKSTPDTEKENKHYAMSNSICSGLMKFALVEAAAIPIENAIKKIDKNQAKYISAQTLEYLPPRAYKLITQTIKLSVGFLTAIPKSMLTVALIPIVMGKLFAGNKAGNQEGKPAKDNKEITFTGSLSKTLSKIVENKKIQNLAIKYQNNDRDIAKHITAGTDILLTSVSAHQINKSKDIKENRKKALIYNNVISTGITLAVGYGIDRIVKNKGEKFIEQFKQINAHDPKLGKYIEGLNIVRPALIFAGIYYAILPIFSTYMAEKIDKFVNKQNKEL